MIGDFGPANTSWKVDEDYARLHYTEAAVIIEKILRGYNICEDGRRIAWRSAKLIQNALDAARRGE